MDRWQPTSESREIEREMSEALQWRQLAEGLAARAIASGWTQAASACEICGKPGATRLRCPGGHVLHLDCSLIDVDEDAGEPLLVCPVCHPSEVDAEPAPAPPAANVFASALELGWSLAGGRRCEVCLDGAGDEPVTLACPRSGHVVHARCCETDTDGDPTCPLCEAA